MKIKFFKQHLFRYSDEILKEIMELLWSEYNEESILEVSYSGFTDADLLIEEYDKDKNFLGKRFISINDDIIAKIIPNEIYVMDVGEYLMLKEHEETIEFYKDMDEMYEVYEED